MILRKLKENGGLPSEMTSLGASLKKARESRGISLDRIAAETRISTRFLLAIENEEFHLLPGGIFNRGFVRAYAEKVGLDPDQAIAAYERLTEVRAPVETPTVTPPATKRNRHLYQIVIGGLALLIFILYLVTRGGPNSAQTANPAPTNSPVAAAEPAPALPAEPAVPPTPAAPLAPPTTPPEVTSAAPEPEPPAPTAPVRVDIEAKETTWIKVKSDGTTLVPGEVLEPGTVRHFTAQNSLYLAVGNAGGLAVKINDMPAKMLGKAGRVLQVVITPQNVQSFVE